MARQCGYCRQVGHNKPKCPVMEYQIAYIKKFIPAERRNIIELLKMNGYGVGAIVETYSYRTGGFVKAIISSHEYINSHYNNFVDYKNIKYQKRVKIILKNFSGVYPVEMDLEKANNEISIINLNSFSLPAMNLADPSENVYCNVLYNHLVNKFSETAMRRGYTYETHSELVVPSNESDCTDDMLIRDIPMHERLLDKRYVNGTVTW